MSKASKAQQNALIAAIGGAKEADIPARTFAVLVREGWYSPEDEVITEAGVVASGAPTYEQNMVRITRPLTYNCPIKKKTLRFQSGATFMITMGHRKGRNVFMDVLTNMDGEAHMMRIYRPAGAEFFTQLMPNVREMQEKGLIDG